MRKTAELSITKASPAVDGVWRFEGTWNRVGAWLWQDSVRTTIRIFEICIIHGMPYMFTNMYKKSTTHYISAKSRVNF